jgi:hypothetical protein
MSNSDQQLTGVVLELVGTTLSVAGLNVQKWSFLNRGGGGVLCCGLKLGWRWLLGFVVFATGQVIEMAALSYADQSLLTTLTSLSLVTNAVIAHIFFGEPFNLCPPLNRRTALGSDTGQTEALLLREAAEEAEAAAAIAAVAAVEEGGRRPDMLPSMASPDAPSSALYGSGRVGLGSGRQSPGFATPPTASDAAGRGARHGRSASCNPVLDRFKTRIPSFTDLLKEWDLLFVVLIFTGVGVASYNAPPIPEELRIDHAAGKPDLAVFVGYFRRAIAGATFAALGLVLLGVLARLTVWGPASGKQRMQEGGFLFGAVAALTGTLSTCFSKPTVTLLKNQIATAHGQYDLENAPTIAAWFGLFFIFAAASLVALNMGLARHEAVAVYSAYSVLNTALTAVSGVTLYSTYDGWTNTGDGLEFFGGVVLSLVAVGLMLAQRSAPTPAEMESRWRTVQARISHTRRRDALGRSAQHHTRAVSEDAAYNPPTSARKLNLLTPSGPAGAGRPFKEVQQVFDTKDAQGRRAAKAHSNDSGGGRFSTAPSRPG